MSNTRRGEYLRKLREADADAAAGTLIPIKPKRLHRVNFTLALVEELPAVFTVFAASASALHTEHDATGYAIAAAELITGACVLVAIAVEARHLFGRRAEHAHASPHDKPSVDLSKLAAAALGYTEAWHHAHIVGHFKLVSPAVLGATVSLITANIKSRPLSVRRQRRRPHVAITPAGISYRGGVRRKWTAAWEDVAAVEHDGGELAVRLHDGRRHVLRPDDHLAGEAVLAEAREAIAAHAPHIPGAVS